MAILTALTTAELTKVRQRKGPNLTLIQPYLTFLAPMNIGEGGRAGLEPGETPRLVKRRLTAAAKIQGKRLKYRSVSDKEMLFEIMPLLQERGPDLKES